MKKINSTYAIYFTFFGDTTFDVPFNYLEARTWNKKQLTSLYLQINKRINFFELRLKHDIVKHIIYVFTWHPFSLVT
jgi:hypothetical protein